LENSSSLLFPALVAANSVSREFVSQFGVSAAFNVKGYGISNYKNNSILPLLERVVHRDL
jgi:hypothetical protein